MNNNQYGMTMKEFAVTRNALINYIEGIIIHLKSIIDIDSFESNMRAGHKVTSDYLDEELERLRKEASVDLNTYRQAYFAQGIINAAYETYYTELVSNGYVAGKAFLEQVLDNPDKFINDKENDLKKELYPKTKSVEIIGSRIEYVPYRNAWDCDQGEVDEDITQPHYIITFKIAEKNAAPRYYEINAYEYEDSCYSGWCGADYGSITINRTQHVDITSKIKPEFKTFNMPIELYEKVYHMATYDKIDVFDIVDSDTLDDISLFEIPGVLSVSAYGGDEYYPCGYANFCPEAFDEPCVRQNRDEAKVWIFKGNSGAGKTFLGNILEKKLKVFETDSYKELPDRIVASVIIMGNKYNHTIEEIEERMKFPHETIIVDFSK